MPSDENQKKVFDFFVSHLETKVAFSRQEIEKLTSWKGKTFGTYWSKQLRPLVVKDKEGRNKYRVSESFRRYATWEKFQQYVTQVRRASVDYKRIRFDVVRVYEFFMPLTNEVHLRTALDTLFYKDTIEARLRTIDPSELQNNFQKELGEPESHYIDRLCEWLSGKFGGYSIYHVSGRPCVPQWMKQLRSKD